MEIRSGLLVLTKMIEHYPMLKKVAVPLEKRLVKIKEEEGREDLKILATR